MKLEKKHYVIIGIVLGTILVWYFYFRKQTKPLAVHQDYKIIKDG
jgi:hypothetical protein